MAFQFSTAVRNAWLDAIEAAIGTSVTLEIRSGAVPANCAAADAGTLLASAALPSDWMAAAAAGSKAMAGTWQDPASDATGKAGHFRVKAGATCHIQGIACGTWQTSKAYAVGEHAVNGGSLYRCTTAGTSAASGGPTGTGSGIADGTAVWTFVQVGGDMIIDNPDLVAGQGFNITSWLLTASGA